MSKKDHSKFKKRIKSQIMQDFARAEEVSAPPKETSQVPAPQFVKPSAAPANKAEPTANLDFVKTDLKKSAIIIGSLIIVIIAIYFIDQKTNFLLQSSEFILKFSNL